MADPENGVAEGKNEIVESYALTPLQHGLIFHTLLAPSAGIDVEQNVIHLDEEVDSARLRRAWDLAAARHPILRTRLRLGDNPPVQEVLAHSPPKWIEQDWSHDASTDDEDRFSRFLSSDRLTGFDLERSPAWRLSLVRRSGGRVSLVWAFHHVLLDGIAARALMKEVFHYYDGTAHDAKTPRPFRDYVDWLEHSDFDQSEPYWREVLEGMESPTQLTIDSGSHRSIVAEEDYRAGQVEADLSPSLSNVIREFAQNEQVTLNSIVIGAWALLLARYGAGTDVLFGVSRSCRRTGVADAESIIGLVLNTLPMRVSVDPETEVGPWLRYIKSRWRDMRPHEHSPLIKVRSCSRFLPNTPLFETAVMFRTKTLTDEMRSVNEHWRTRSCQGLSQPNIPVMLGASDGPRIRLSLTYDRRRIEDGSARQMLQHLQRLFEAMTADGRRKLQDISLVSEENRLKELSAWNQTSVAFEDSDATLYELFERQALETPEAVAIVSGEDRWTYSELRLRAAHASRALADLGVERGSLVAICAPRSPATIAAIFGILRAGCAWVPISPAYPPERIAFMVSDSGAALFVADLQGLETVRLPKGLRSALVEDLVQYVGRDPGRAIAGSTSDLAYVIYTSGSTGQPKGVSIENGAIVNHLLWMQNAFPIGQNDAVLQNTALSFDVSVWEIFGTLASGARLVLPLAGPADPTRLSRLIEEENVTVLQLVPSLLSALLDTSEFAACKSLRHVFCGGEAMHEDLPARFFAALQCDLHNMYGPTETAIDALFHTLPKHHRGDVIPIGRPVANMRAYVLDENLSPVPAGTPGELCLAGVQLARGYHNASELTSERFPCRTLSGNTNERLYRTGDRVRRLANGDLVFLGRIDHQIKIRGVRIEPGETEHALRRHPAVKEVVVLARRGASGEAGMVAYVAARNNSVSGQDLRDLARRLLPLHAVPDWMVLLEEMPTLANGKFDRKALERLEPTLVGNPTKYLPPSTRSEIQLAAMWSELLGAHEIGLNDNFFDLGGHSLLAVRLANLINKSFGANISLAKIYTHPELNQMAELLSDGSVSEKRQPAVVTLRHGEADALPIYLVNAGLLELRQAQLMGPGTVYGLEVQWPTEWFDAAAAGRDAGLPDMDAMAGPLFDLLSTHAGRGPCIVAGHSLQGIVAFELARRLIDQGGEVPFVILFDTAARHPGPMAMFWRRLKKRITTDLTFDSLAKTLDTRLRKTINAITRGPDPKPIARDLTGIADVKGIGQPWRLVESISISVEKSFHPRRIASRGILFRAMQLSENASKDPAFGWGRLFAKGLEIVWLPERHATIYGAELPNPLTAETTRNVVKRVAQTRLD